MASPNPDADTPPPSVSHARSCTTCAKAKTKCVKDAGAQVCTRCARLGKECCFKEPSSSRRRKISKSSRAAQFEKLESKIEHLVNALASSQTQTQTRTPATSFQGQLSPPVSHPDTTSSSNKQYEILNTLCSGDGCVVEQPVESHTATPASACSSLVSLSEAELLLDRYRRVMAPGIPFVVLPANITAAQLHQEKPFLLRCIVTVAWIHDLSRQAILMKHCMRDLADRVIVNNEKNLGLVEGMLVLVSWYHPHVFTQGQLTNVLNLAVAMAADLGIDRPPSTCGGFKPNVTRTHDATNVTAATLAEHRVFAGVYYLTSMLATAFVKFRATPFTQYLDESLERLSAAQEHESDQSLIQLVRLQRLVEDIHAASPSAAPPRMYITAFQTSLNKLRRADRHNDDNGFLRLQYLAVDVQLWELTLNDLQEKRAPVLPNQLEELASLVNAIKSLLDLFFSIPISSYLAMPFSCFNQFAHAFIALTKLATLENEGWSLDDLKETIDFRSRTDQAMARFDAVASSRPDGMSIRNDTFNAWSQRLGWMRQAYDNKFPMDLTGCCDVTPDGKGNVNMPGLKSGLQHQIQQPHQLSTPPDNLLFDDFFTNFDDAFWNSFRPEMDLDFSVMRAA